MRSRNIKPGFFENEKLAELDPLARILFAGLWCYADREGRFEWRPKRIKALILPYDDVDPECLLQALYMSGHVLKYAVNGVEYGCIPTFLLHQNPHSHEAKSRIPEPNQCLDMSSTSTVHVPDKDGSRPAESLIPESNIYCAPEEHSPSPPPNGIPYKQIIEYLNQKTGKRFSAGRKETQRHIRARWNTGFRLEDFKRVIDTKCSKWLTDSKMVDYLRPETLFGTKFESYLNEGSPMTEGTFDFDPDLGEIR